MGRATYMTYPLDNTHERHAHTHTHIFGGEKMKKVIVEIWKKGQKVAYMELDPKCTIIKEVVVVVEEEEEE